MSDNKRVTAFIELCSEMRRLAADGELSDKDLGITLLGARGVDRIVARVIAARRDDERDKCTCYPSGRMNLSPADGHLTHCAWYRPAEPRPQNHYLSGCDELVRTPSGVGIVRCGKGTLSGVCPDHGAFWTQRRS